MNNTKEEENKGFPWSIVFLSIAVIVIIGVMVYLQIPHHPEEDYLQDEIDNMENVSNEYRQGWNDCIAALHKFNRMITNITARLSI